jgi:hypothetical protein
MPSTRFINRRTMLISGGAGAVALAAPGASSAAPSPLSAYVALSPPPGDASDMLDDHWRAGPVQLLPGRYVITRSLTSPHHVSFAPGACLVLGAGVKLTLAGGLTAPVNQIVDGPGTLLFAQGAQPLEGYPEWWGARTNDGHADNRAAFTQCLDACPLMRLSNADYFFQDTWVAAQSHRTIRGHYGDYADTGRGTRLILTGKAAHTRPQMILGQFPPPPDHRQAAWYMRLEDVALIRDAGQFPLTPASPRNDYLAIPGLIVGGLVHSAVSACMWPKARSAYG